MFNAIRVVPVSSTTQRGGKARGKASRGGTGGGAGVLVLGVFTDRTLDSEAASLDRELGGVLGEAVKRPECTGEKGRLVEAFVDAERATGLGFSRVIIAGLGEKKGFEADTLRTIAGYVGRRLAVVKATSVRVELSGALKGVSGGRKTKPERAGRCFGEGLGLIGWNHVTFKGTATDAVKRTELEVSSSDEAFGEGLETGLSLAASTNITRDLSNTPPNVATTSYIADFAKRLAKETGLSCKVFEGDALEKEGFVGLINVGKASENKPCLIRLEYTPKGEKKAKGKPAVFVGKTMTYDTGGLSLKVNNGMVGMKRDKDGGCAVLGAMHAIATVIKPRRPVVALLAVAENSISDEAYRPDDILTYRNGVTVEVTNTDAEGRLVLADALIWACEKEDPEYIVDIATLTGGVVTALGSTFAGLFSDDQRMLGKFERAAEASGERWWRLPLDQEYRDMMKSPIADILNSNPNRKAHAGQGAAFLSYFVKANIPWVHLDIAGVHASESDNGCIVKGPTGYGTRLLADLAAQD